MMCRCAGMMCRCARMMCWCAGRDYIDLTINLHIENGNRFI
jgi:hypothetical protein